MLIVRVQPTTEARAVEAHHVLTGPLRVHQDHLLEAATAALRQEARAVHIPEVVLVALEVQADLIPEVAVPAAQEVLVAQEVQEAQVAVDLVVVEDNHRTEVLSKKLLTKS